MPYLSHGARRILLSSVSALLVATAIPSPAQALTALEQSFIAAEDAQGAAKIAQWKALLKRSDLQGASLAGISRAKVQLNLVGALIQEATASKNSVLLQEAIRSLEPLKSVHPKHYVWSLLAISRKQVDLGSLEEAHATLGLAQKALPLLKDRNQSSRAVAGVVLTLTMMKEGKPLFGKSGLEESAALMDSIVGAQQYAESSEARARVFFALNQPSFLAKMPKITNTRNIKEIDAQEDYIEKPAYAFLKDGSLQEALQYAQAMPLSRSGRRAKLMEAIYQAALKKKDETLALTALRSIARGPEQGVPMSEFARMLIARKDYTQAERVAGLIEDPRHASVIWSTLAKEYYNQDKQSQTDKALAAAEAAADRETKDMSRKAEAYGRLLRAAAETERFDLATRVLPLTAEERRGEGQAALAKKLAERDRVDEALAVYKTMPDKVPGGRAERALAAIIKTLADENRLSEAEQWMKQPGTEDTIFDRARVALVKRYLKEKKPDSAQKHLRAIKDPKLRKEAEDLLEKQHGALAAGSTQKELEITTQEQADAHLKGLQGEALDKARSEAAIALVKHGQIELAVRYVKPIANGFLRVRTFRALAELQAAQTDYFKKLPASAFGKPVAAPKLTVPQTKPARPSDKMLVAFAKETSALAKINEELPIIRQPLASGFGVHVPDIPHVERLTRDTAYVKKQMPTKMTDIKAGLMSYELCLYNIKLVYANGHEDFVRRQQTASPQVIYLEEGVTTLPKLYEVLQQQGTKEAITREGNMYMLRLPLVIGPKATLIISGEGVDNLRMSEERGAYIVNAGRLFIVETHVTAWRESAQTPSYSDYANSKKFRPFIMTWSASEAYFAGSIFTALGYSNSKSYGITISAGPERMLRFRHEKIKRPTAVIVDNSFDNAYYGFYCYEAADITLVGNEFVNNIIYGIDPHDYSERLTIGYNTAYGSKKKHGIIISREVNNSALVGNLSFENYGSGLMVERMSAGTIVYGNTAFANVQDGLTIYESHCSINASNHFFANERIGINVRNSVDVGLFYNYVERNAKAGLHGYTLHLRTEPKHQTRDFNLDPYMDMVAFSAVGNMVKANGNGLQADIMSALYLRANQFVEQSPNLLKGDWSGIFPTVLTQHNIDKEGVLMTRRCSLAKEYVHKPCSFRNQGYFAGDGQDDLVNRLQENPCKTEAAASPQEAL